MEISFNTPALLFPAISLLLLAYTNRFLALANLVRKLHDDYKAGQRTQTLLRQIHSLRLRLRLVRYMQGLSSSSSALVLWVISSSEMTREMSSDNKPVANTAPAIRCSSL